MKSTGDQTGFSPNLITTWLLGCALTGCMNLGPAAINNGRLAYNEAILDTDNRQLLMAIVHNRYEERGSLLAVSSITANVRVVTSAGVNLGFGNSENYAGNLVPLSAGVLYEENPTISYTPVAGEAYSRQVMSPISVGTLAQLSGAFVDPTYIYFALVSSVNGIQNPDFLFSSDAPDPRFTRLVALIIELTQANRLRWVMDSQPRGDFSVVIDQYEPDFVAEVSELLALLGLPALADQSPQIFLPVSVALDGRPTGGIGITMRTIFELVQILSAAIEVPESEMHDGIAARYPPAGLAGMNLQVRHAQSRPERSAVAVQHRGDWYYIDETDRATKQYFRLLATLWSATIADSSAKGASTPVLTIPVSR